MNCICVSLVSALVLLGGCSHLLPRAEQEVINPWKDFAEALASYDKIVPYATHIEAVRELGFAPNHSANTQVLNQAQVVDDVVVYKQWSGEPKIEFTELRINPLGPLQSMGETLKVAP